MGQPACDHDAGFGGGRALSAAASFPGEIVAAASFADKIAARAYVGMAGVDGSFPPDQSALLTKSLRTGGVDFTIKNYVGMHHGWTVPDRDGVYDERGDKRHWSRLLGLFSETLGGGRN